MTCPITGYKCLKEKCRQYIPPRKSTITHCKFDFIYEKVIKFQGLADILKEVRELKCKL